MKLKMKKKINAVICLAVTVACMMSVPVMKVNAAGDVQGDVENMDVSVGEVPESFLQELRNARAVLSGCKITVGFSSSGLGITVYTGTTDKCPVVGVKDIKVEQRVWYGWKEVAYADGAELTDTDAMSVYMTFTGAVKDETYRVSCTHYADLTYDGVENYTEGSNNTGSFVFTY